MCRTYIPIYVLLFVLYYIFKGHKLVDFLSIVLNNKLYTKINKTERYRYTQCGVLIIDITYKCITIHFTNILG